MCPGSSNKKLLFRITCRLLKEAEPGVLPGAQSPEDSILPQAAAVLLSEEELSASSAAAPLPREAAEPCRGLAAVSARW